MYSGSTFKHRTTVTWLSQTSLSGGSTRRITARVHVASSSRAPLSFPLPGRAFYCWTESFGQEQQQSP